MKKLLLSFSVLFSVITSFNAQIFTVNPTDGIPKMVFPKINKGNIYFRDKKKIDSMASYCYQPGCKLGFKLYKSQTINVKYIVLDNKFNHY